MVANSSISSIHSAHLAWMNLAFSDSVPIKEPRYRHPSVVMLRSGKRDSTSSLISSFTISHVLEGKQFFKENNFHF